jgi:hypothetical protein
VPVLPGAREHRDPPGEAARVQRGVL